MPRVRKPTVASFSPMLMEVWRQALQRKIRIPCLNKKDATRLRFRLYELRAAMKEENHKDYTSAIRVTLRLIEDDQHQWYVLAEHADTAFASHLAAAGIEDPTETPPSLDELLEIPDSERQLRKE